jgi:protein NrfC
LGYFSNQGDRFMAERKKAEHKDRPVLRREFLSGAGAAVAAGALAVYAPEATAGTKTSAAAAKGTYAESTGYIVYDSRLCLGCQSCMYACAMTHEGEGTLSLARIQIIRDAPSFTKYPYDIVMSVCRQCVSPLCVQNCPTGACHVDAAHGNVRMVNQSLCIGCMNCINACPQRPHRTIWNPVKKKSAKCDLCSDAPFWSQKGGPAGKQACVTICPAKALKLVHKAPSQADVTGYDINLYQAPKPPDAPAKKEGA